MKHITSKDGIKIGYCIKRISDNFISLHPGSTMNHTSLIPLSRMLNEKGYSTIIIEPRINYNTMPPPKEEYFTLDRHTDDIETILEKEDVKKPIMIGHSYGFMPIAKYVAHTNNAKSIVGISSSYNFYKTTNRFLYHIFDRIISHFTYVKSLFSHSYPDQSNLLGKPDWYLTFKNGVRIRDARTVVKSGKHIRRWDIKEYLKKIKLPILLIYGKDDIMVRPDEFMRSIGDIVVVDGGHSLPITRPDRVLGVLSRKSFI